ncbi:MAG: YfcZ/YiiS family protein [Pasteurellaceae bacterium]|nr:YfcZ/YiiS family protein [Pasteurellaceae bacterium]
MTKTLSDKVESCKNGCKPSDTRMFDNSENSLQFELSYATEAEAQTALDYLLSKAREVETEPCQIQSEIRHVENGVQLNAQFTFSCQAEVVIFQMKLR